MDKTEALKTMITRTLLILLCILVTGGGIVSGQQSERCKSPIEYENHNQVDYGPLSIRAVTGRASDKDRVSIPGVCLGLFTEKEHRLVAQTITDQEGRFHFSVVPKGRYRLVAQYPGFCSANVPLRIVRWPGGGLLKARHIVLHMEPTAIDHCSFGSYK